MISRILLSLFLLLFVLVGCARPADEPVASDPPDAVIQIPIPTLDDMNAGLLNYRDWLLRHHGDISPNQVELDILSISQLEEDGYVVEAVFFPSVWPAGILGGSIPEYTGAGYLYELFVVHPNMSYRSGDIRNMVITIYEYEESGVLEYIEGLVGFTRDEEKEKDFMETYPSESSTPKAIRYFSKDEISFFILFAEDNSGDYIQFYINYAREPYVLDTESIGATRLQNVVEWVESNVAPAGHDLVLDEHTESYVDEIGRQVDVVIHPSIWPKDIFGDLIPVYGGEGFMVELVVSTPHEDPYRDKALIASLFIEGFKYEDIDSYVHTLVDFGYQELAPEEYSEQDANLSEGNNVYHVLNLPGIRCFAGTVYDHGVEQLQITLRFEGRYKKFFEDLYITEG